MITDPDLKDSEDTLVVKQRYYVSKTLTILFRDFYPFLQEPDQLAPQLWHLSLQNLAYLQPHFQLRVLNPQTVQDYEQDLCFQSTLVQILSLLSTLSQMCPQPYFSQNTEETLYLLCSLCLLPHETIQLFEEDKNAFLTAFLDESADLMTSISLRMSVVELLEETYLQAEGADRGVLQAVL